MKARAWLAALAAIPLLPVPAAAEGQAPPREAPARLVGTVLKSASIDRELAFYRTAFGMTLAMTLDHGQRREYMLRFSADPGEAGLILVHDSAPGAPARLTHGDAFDRIVLRVTDMDGLLARLDAAGIAHPPAREVAQGYRVLQLEDPEGYSLEVIQSTRALGAPR